MKTLNRPMFRYGGPIKEGIMDGIKEPRQNYKEAGDVQKNMYTKNNPQPGNTVAYRNYLEKQMYPDNIIGGISRATGMMGDAAFNYGIKPLANLSQYILPLSSTPVKSKNYVDDNIDDILRSKGLLNEKTISDIVDDKGTKNTKTKKTPEQIELEKANALLAKEEFADKEKAKRLENYRKIMDIEGMNKDATYDSLIAASQAVLGEGDFKGSLKDGSLINKIIGSTSKAFQKPRDTKNAINTLLLKNQMAADTPSTALKDLIALGIDTPEKQEMYLRTKMGLPANMGAAKAAVQKAGSIGAKITSDAAELMYQDEYKGDIIDKDKFKKIYELEIKKGEGRPNDILIGIIKGEAEANGYPPGKYTVGDVLVDVDEDFNVSIVRG